MCVRDRGEGGWRGTREHLRVGTAEGLTRGSQGSPLALERPLETSCAGDAVPAVLRRLEPDGPDFDRLQ